MAIEEIQESPYVVASEIEAAQTGIQQALEGVSITRAPYEYVRTVSSRHEAPL